MFLLTVSLLQSLPVLVDGLNYLFESFDFYPFQVGQMVSKILIFLKFQLKRICVYNQTTKVLGLICQVEATFIHVRTPYILIQITLLMTAEIHTIIAGSYLIIVQYFNLLLGIQNVVQSHCTAILDNLSQIPQPLSTKLNSIVKHEVYLWWIS